MSKNLVIVESPAKAKTISKFLDKDYVVLASMGHVRDLPKSQMGIDVEHGFEPTYLIPVDKRKVIKELKSKLKSGTTVWLATDHDREGEAIGWHLLKALEVKQQPIHRIVFHEITKSAILDSMNHPQSLNHDLVNAQQARRVLDRLVGYELSPLLWKKIRYGLSAGRVQSVALRLVVDREREREAFVSEEYWSITGTFHPDSSSKQLFSAKLFHIKGKPALIPNEATAKTLHEVLNDLDYRVSQVERKEVHRTPAPPFTTSTLQQEAARKLRMSVKKTMVVAQQLYEGIDLGEGTQGLITYMRTDSVFLATSATSSMRDFIRKEYGEEYALATPRHYKSKKGAQEAHEAIRPVDIALTPESLKKYLDKDQCRLYELIWKRALASQMGAAVLDRMTIDLQDQNKEYTFRATGQAIRFPGFIKLYVEGTDEPSEEEGQAEGLLPEMDDGQPVVATQFDPQQHFTQPPPRYTEASLVKKLETEGIGRPSTYAPTISTILSREYVKKEAGALMPTDVGTVVTDVLVAHFPQIVDIGFTAKMEDDLDEIAEGKQAWDAFLAAFYQPFHQNILDKQVTLKKEDVVNEQTDERCDRCKKPMVIKLGRYGKFLSCSDYPKCKNARPLNENPEQAAALQELQRKLGGKTCPQCGKAMEVKRGRYGEFLGCTGYPKCRQMQSIVKFTGVKCPDCGEGQLVERRTKKGGRLFYGCNRFPKCKFATWDKPLEESCKHCGGLQVQKAEQIVCVQCKRT